MTTRESILLASTILLVLLLAQIAHSGVQQGGSARFPPNSLVPNLIPEDSVQRIVDGATLSREQAAFARACYESYLAEVGKLHAKVQDRIDRDGAYAERRRLGANAPVEVAYEAAKSVGDAGRSVRPEYLSVEAKLFECIGGIIPDPQARAYRRTFHSIERETWLTLSPRVRQDFYEFADPIALLDSGVRDVPLSEDATTRLQDILNSSEEHLASVLPSHWFDLLDARRALTLATIVEAPDKTDAAIRNVARSWSRIYGALSTILESGCAVLEGEGQVDVARAIRERFWQGCFPDLVGFEFVPATYEAVIRDRKTLGEDLYAAVVSMRAQYVSQRHELLKRAVAGHVRDFRRIIDQTDRVERLALAPLGCSSRDVAAAQLERCRLSQKNLELLTATVGSIDAYAQANEVVAIRRDAKAGDQVAFDSTAVERSLVELLAQLSDTSPSTQGDNE